MAFARPKTTITKSSSFKAGKMEFYTKPLSRNLIVFSAIGMIAAGLLGLIISNTLGLPLVSGVTVLIIFFAKGNQPLVILHDDHLEMKAAPLAKKHLIRYTDVKYLTSASPKQAYFFFTNRKGSKKISLPLVALSADDRKQLMNALRNKLRH